MKSIQSLKDLLEHEGNLDVVRTAIADYLADELKRGKAANDNAALPHLINAIGSFTLSINGTRQPLRSGLSTCLSDLEKARVAIDGNEKWRSLLAKSVEMLTYDFLIESFEAIRTQVSSPIAYGKQSESRAGLEDDTASSYRNRDSQSDSGNSKWLV